MRTAEQRRTGLLTTTIQQAMLSASAKHSHNKRRNAPATRRSGIFPRTGTKAVASPRAAAAGRGRTRLALPGGGGRSETLFAGAPFPRRNRTAAVILSPAKGRWNRTGDVRGSISSCGRQVLLSLRCVRATREYLTGAQTDLCVVTNSLGVCSVGTSEQGTMELCEMIHGQSSERTGTWLCLPSPSTGSSPPSRRKIRAAAQDGNKSCRCRKEKYRISPLQPTPPPALPGNQGCSGPLGCPAASAVRYPPLRFHRSLPPTYLENYVLEYPAKSFAKM